MKGQFSGQSLIKELQGVKAEPKPTATPVDHPAVVSASQKDVVNANSTVAPPTATPDSPAPVNSIS